MSKINCTIFDKKSNKLKNVGFMEIKIIVMGMENFIYMEI